MSWSEISMSVLQRKLLADLQRWLVSCYCVIIAQIKWKKNTHTGIYYNDTFPIKRLVLQKWQGYCSGTWKNGTWPGTKGSREKEKCWGKNKNITKGNLNCCCFFFFLKEMVADLDTGKMLLKSINLSGNFTCCDWKSGWN